MPIDCNQPPAPREGLTVVSHNKIDLQVWKPQLLVGFYPRSPTRSNGVRAWVSVKRGIKARTLWNACLVDFLLAHPETVQYYRREYQGMIFVFAGTEYKQVGYTTVDRKVISRVPRRVMRGLLIGEGGAWEEVIVPQCNPFLNGRHVFAVVP